jgi:hypothetical protein
MFCKRADLGKTIKLPGSGGNRVARLQIQGFANN